MQETVVKKIFRDDTKLWLETSTPNSHNVEIRNFITKDGVTYIVDGCFGQLYAATKEQYPKELQDRIKVI